MSPTAPIRTEVDYERALLRLEDVFDAPTESAAADEAEVLAILIEDYENRRFPISLPDPIEAIRFRMEQLGLKQKDLEEVIGRKSRVSEVLNRKRKLTLGMIRRIHAALHVPTEVLVQEY